MRKVGGKRVNQKNRAAVMDIIHFIALSFTSFLLNDFALESNLRHVNEFVEVKLVPVMDSESNCLLGITLRVENNSNIHDIALKLPLEFSFTRRVYPLHSDRSSMKAYRTGIFGDYAYESLSFSSFRCRGSLSPPRHLIPKSSKFEKFFPLSELLYKIIMPSEEVAGYIKNNTALVDFDISVSSMIYAGLYNQRASGVKMHRLPLPEIELVKSKLSPVSSNATFESLNQSINKVIPFDAPTLKVKKISTSVNSVSEKTNDRVNKDISSDVLQAVESGLFPVLDPGSNSLIGIGLRVENKSKIQDVLIQFPKDKLSFSYSINLSPKDDLDKDFPSSEMRSSSLPLDSANGSTNPPRFLIGKSAKFEIVFPLIDLIIDSGGSVTGKTYYRPSRLHLLDLVKRETVLCEASFTTSFPVRVGVYHDALPRIDLHSLPRANISLDRVKMGPISVSGNSASSIQINNESIRLVGHLVKGKIITHDEQPSYLVQVFRNLIVKEKKRGQAEDP